MSVMRDTLVPITYNGKTTYGKINSAYRKGGPELAIKTLNTIFGLDISEYATVNFYGMADIIDAVGGIEVELAKGELDTMVHEYGYVANLGLNGNVEEICKYKGLDPSKYYIKSAGVQHLNGVQAVAYARIRHAANAEGVNDDYGRTDRQRLVMEQLFNKAVKLGKSEYVGLAKALIPCSETSLSYSEIISLAFNILLKSPTFEQTRIPMFEYQMSSKSVKGVGSCVYYDLNYASKLIKAFIYDDIKPEDYIAANGVEKNDWYGNKGGTAGSTGSKISRRSLRRARRLRLLSLPIIPLRTTALPQSRKAAFRPITVRTALLQSPKASLRLPRRCRLKISLPSLPIRLLLPTVKTASLWIKGDIYACKFV